MPDGGKPTTKRTEPIFFQKFPTGDEKRLRQESTPRSDTKLRRYRCRVVKKLLGYDGSENDAQKGDEMGRTVKKEYK